jgi:cell pole-organizing protein PopZ
LLAIVCCPDVPFSEAARRFAAVECGVCHDLAADDVESEMTQPAKAQEPSMEEILASIRRIISDDETKPAAAAPAPVKTEVPKAEPARPAAAAPPARPQVMAGIPPSKIAPTARPAAPAAAPAAKNSQADIDAMLAEFDAPAPAARVEEPEPEADVFELTEQMALPETPPPPAPTFRKVDPEDDLEFSEPPAPPPAASRSPALDAPAYAEPARERPQAPILSGSTVTAVESAFNALANTVLSNNARTLEDLVKEMLRPMLKSWLDDNLPNLVERIVKAEIERVSRGR